MSRVNFESDVAFRKQLIKKKIIYDSFTRFILVILVSCIFFFLEYILYHRVKRIERGKKYFFIFSNVATSNNFFFFNSIQLIKINDESIVNTLSCEILYTLEHQEINYIIL